MAGAVKEVTDGNFEQEVVNSDKLSLVDFWAPWCGPCRMVGPIVEELADDFEGQVNVGKVNIDDNTEVAKQFSITSIPTLMFFKDGELVEKVVGAVPKNQLEAAINKHLN